MEHHKAIRPARSLCAARDEVEAAMGVEMSSVGAPRGKHAASHSIAHQPRRHEVTFLLGLVAFAILTVTWTSLLPSTALPGVRRGDFHSAAPRDVSGNGVMRTTRGGVFHGRGSARNHPSFVTDSSAARRLILASHGRLLWFDVDTRETEEIHQGRGVYYGVFPADDDGESVWVVSRPHNWRPKNTLEALLRIDLRSKQLVQEVAIPSHFTHDAVRQGDKVYVADTGGGGVRELLFPSMRPTGRVASFTVREHVNTIAPAGDPRHPDAVWALLHNLGSSKLVLVDMATGTRVREFQDVANKAHGLVPWEGGFIILNSGEGQLCKFTPPPESAPSDAKGILVVLWRDQQKTFMKGLSVIDGVAYFGIAEFGDRSQRDDEGKTAEVAAFDLRTRTFLWRHTVETHGLLNIVAAPHLAEWSTYKPVQHWDVTSAKARAASMGSVERAGASAQSQRMGVASNKYAPSGSRWIDLKEKGNPLAPDMDDLLIQHGSVDVSEIRAALDAMPDFCRSSSQTDNAKLGGRKGNMDQFKPGVDSAIMIFSDFTGELVFKFPYYDRFEALIEPVLKSVMEDHFGIRDHMRHVIRLQFACMNPRSKILKHTDKGGWVRHGHRIHVPIIVPRAAVEKDVQFVMMHPIKGDIDVPLVEGDVFEINNGIQHRVNNDAESWRIHLLLDFKEDPVPLKNRFALRPGQECGYHDLPSCRASSEPWE